jgi:hypothetical protein
VQICPANGEIFRFFFYRAGQSYAVTVESDDGSLHDGGEWPKISEADEWARLMVADMIGNQAKVDPLAKYRGSGYLLLATFDGLDHAWAVVAGNKRNGRYEDTGTRFKTKVEARSVIDAH